MSRYGFLTFNPHSNDTYLNKEFINTIHPILKKMKQYALVIEKCDSPGEHVHLYFAHDGQTEQKVKQKVEVKATTLFIKNRLQGTMTVYDKAFNYGLVGNTEHDKMYTLGYTYKDGYEKESKGFSQEYVTKCVQYYHTHERNQAKVDPSNGWKVLGLRNAHAEIEHFAEKNDIKITDKTLYLQMKQQRISFCQISKKQQDIIHDELVVANIKKEKQITKPDSSSDQFCVNLAEKNIIQGEANDWYKELYLRLITDLMNEKDMNNHRFKIETMAMAEELI